MVQLFKLTDDLETRCRLINDTQNPKQACDLWKVVVARLENFTTLYRIGDRKESVGNVHIEL